MTMMHFWGVNEQELEYELSNTPTLPPPLPPVGNELLLIAFVAVWGGKEMFNLQSWWHTVPLDESVHRDTFSRLLFICIYLVSHHSDWAYQFSIPILIL